MPETEHAGMCGKCGPGHTDATCPKKSGIIQRIKDDPWVVPLAKFFVPMAAVLGGEGAVMNQMVEQDEIRDQAIFASAESANVHAEQNPVLAKGLVEMKRSLEKDGIKILMINIDEVKGGKIGKFHHSLSFKGTIMMDDGRVVPIDYKSGESSSHALMEIGIAKLAKTVRELPPR